MSNIKGTKVQTVTFQLRDEENRVLQEIKRPLLKTDVEVLYENRTPKTVPFKFCHLLVALNLPDNYQNRSLRVTVISPKGRVIYSSPVREKRESVAFIDRVRQ